ncbi:MAG TPA: ABC transporter ATP-binding protein [Atribacterota bacterium]|nr:ABC transporter ATP-binding protein [Atribacterota bacterium]
MKIKVEQVGFSYDRDKEIFSGINLDVNSGEVVSILGPNGIGKTTLLSCLAKIRIPTSGTIFLNGQNMSKMGHRDIARIIGYVPQTIFPSFDYDVLDYVVTGLSPWLGLFEKPKEEHYQLAQNSLKKMGIEYLKRKPYSKISAGELQQVSIARVITQKVQLILMDEPTAHLDYGNQLKVLGIIKEMAEEGYGVVLTTHNPDQVLLLKSKVAVFDRKGQFHFGNWDEVITDDLLEEIYGVKIQICDVEKVQRKVCIAPKIPKTSRRT